MAQYQNPGLPSNLYAGAAVKVDTRPIANLIYQEQRYQQAKAQKEDAALNEEKQANVAKIRDADVPDFVNQYQQYATKKRRLMNDTRPRKDPQAYATAQMEVAKLYGGAMKLANESRQARDLYEHVDKDRFTHPENYVEDYFDKRSTINKTPLSKLRQVQTGVDPTTGQPIFTDYSTPDILVDNTPHYDFSKAINDVKGKPTYTGFQTKKNLDDKGLQYETSAALYGAAPKKVFAGIMDKIASDKQAYRTAVKGGKEITPEIWEDMVRQYKAVLPEEWQKRGLKLDEQDVTKLFHPDNYAEKFAAFKTMQDFVTSKVEFEAPKPRTNLSASKQLDNAEWRNRQDYAHKLNEDEIKLRDSLKNQGVANQEKGIDAYMRGLEKTPGKIHHIDFLDKDGKKILAKEIPATASFLKSFERLDKYGRKLQPTAVYYENGNYYPIFPALQVDKDNNYTGKYQMDANGNTIIDKTLSKPIRRQDVKVNYTQAILPPKMVAETLEEGEVPGRGAPNAPKAPSAPDEDDDVINSYMPNQ